MPSANAETAEPTGMRNTRHEIEERGDARR